MVSSFGYLIYFYCTFSGTVPSFSSFIISSTNHLLAATVMCVVRGCSMRPPCSPSCSFSLFPIYFQTYFCSPSGLRWISLLLGSPASTSLVQVVHVHVGLGADPWIQGLNCVRMTTFCTSAVLGSLSLCAYCTADVASAVW